jgi:hypothetical protein
MLPCWLDTFRASITSIIAGTVLASLTDFAVCGRTATVARMRIMDFDFSVFDVVPARPRQIYGVRLISQDRDG